MSHSVDQTDTVVARTTDLTTDDVITESNTDVQLITTTNNEQPSTDDLTEHTVDHVIPHDDQPHPQDVSTNIKDSPGECHCHKH